MVNAYHNWGRWVADCADPDCPNAEQVSPGQKRMLCSFCHQQSTVEWPTDWAEIETVLRTRPVPSTRNWWPHETVNDLIVENVEHGVM